MGAAVGGDDVLKAVEILKEIMYFDVLQLLGQGCNGAVFKVGRACARSSFLSRAVVHHSLLACPLCAVCPACLFVWLLPYLLACFIISV